MELTIGVNALVVDKMLSVAWIVVVVSKHCCGNDFECPSEEPEVEGWEIALFEQYCEGGGEG